MKKPDVVVNKPDCQLDGIKNHKGGRALGMPARELLY